VGVGGVPSDYLVSTRLEFLLFCCWGCVCRWAETKILDDKVNMSHGNTVNELMDKSFSFVE